MHLARLNGGGTMGRLCMAVALAFALAGSGCKRKHVSVESVPDLPYPTCGDAGAREVLASRTLKGLAESMAEGDATESFEFSREGCLIVFRSHQEFARGVTDTEVVFDDRYVPLRAWKRMAGPAAQTGAVATDTRRYELRTPEVTLKRRTSSDDLVYEILRGTHPEAVIGPGRGILTAWIRHAKLAIGEKTRVPALDFREMLEMMRDVTLKREADRFEPTLQRNVRVYTVYGRDAVFTDEDDVVIGDLAGLRPFRAEVAVGSPAPQAMPPSSFDTKSTP